MWGSEETPKESDSRGKAVTVLLVVSSVFAIVMSATGQCEKPIRPYQEPTPSVSVK